MTKDVYLNDIALAVPDHDVHREFVAFAPSLLQRRSRQGVVPPHGWLAAR